MYINRACPTERETYAFFSYVYSLDYKFSRRKCYLVNHFFNKFIIHIIPPQNKEQAIFIEKILHFQRSLYDLCQFKNLFIDENDSPIYEYGSDFLLLAIEAEHLIEVITVNYNLLKL